MYRIWRIIIVIFWTNSLVFVHRITAICSYHIIQFVQTPVAILYGSYRIVTSVYFHYSNKLYHISKDLKETRAMVCCYYMYRIHS